MASPANAWGEARLTDLEGVPLGTPRQQVGALVEPKGYEPFPPNSDAAGMFRRRTGGSYDEFIEFGYADDRVSSIILRVRRSPAGYEQSREEFVSRFGPPDSCEEPRSAIPVELIRKSSQGNTTAVQTSRSCEWRRKAADQLQRVRVTWGNDRQELYQLEYSE